MMKVKWSIDKSYTVEAFLGDFKASILPMDSTGEMPIFMAFIYRKGEKFWITDDTKKKDRSLIELMNWVEEELKFRSSHESITIK